MSEKKLKQTRLPFQILTSPKTPAASSLPSVEKKSSPRTPKTPKSISTRKRKPSTEGDNLRSTKIVRIAKSKENIAEPETIELNDSTNDDQKNNVSKTLTSVETMPTAVSSTSESVIHIKLPSTTKTRRKQDLKATKSSSIDESEDLDDSIVYLDKEELPSKITKKAKKSAKKNEKKKKNQSSEEDVDRVKKTLEMNDEAVKVSSEEKLTDIDPVEKDSNDKESPKVEEPMDVDELPVMSNEISQLIKASGSSSSPVKDIQDMLSDDENETSLNDQSLNSSFNQSVDSKGKSLVLTPRAQARRKELEDKRLEKELQRKKEREARELQRLKEKEQREEAKRREKEEKDELRKKEREEKEVNYKYSIITLH